MEIKTSPLTDVAPSHAPHSVQSGHEAPRPYTYGHTWCRTAKNTTHTSRLPRARMPAQVSVVGDVRELRPFLVALVASLLHVSLLQKRHTPRVPAGFVVGDRRELWPFFLKRHTPRVPAGP